ncbi:unnamed protein product [Cylicocyclus nassatus]|uniref:DNA polymerase eta n=1 Tax=Cylicocyclus nassatus TaxID=53992 RepID=A0AA36GS22_CYLNA|nr:unnamed protein product [Cylicocyclus nassatus]
MERVIALIDMDCFYVQVEQREKPELWGKPTVVVQHAREGAPGGILAVSYEARKFGVKRMMMIPQAKAKCPELNVCFVPQGEHIDKADIQKYRDASAEVFDVLNNFDERIIVERASVDEAFLDMTELVDKTILEFGAAQLLQNLTSNLSTTLPTTHVADGNDRDNEDVYDREASLRSWLDNRCATEISHLRLAVAAEFVEQMRARIRECTQFYCSGGIGNNKMLAKLICARHKPRQQTIIPFDFVPVIFSETRVGDIRMLGGKLGHAIQGLLPVETMGDLAAMPFELIEKHFGGTARWISQLAKGYDDEPVKPRNNQLSIAVSKNFLGKNALTTVAEVRRYIDGLCKELCKRLVDDQVKNKRTAQNVIFGFFDDSYVRASKTAKITSYSPQAVADAVWGAAKTFNRAPLGSDQWIPPIYNLSMSASRFTEGISIQSKNIMEWVEKRLQSNEAGQGTNQATAAASAEQKASGDVCPLDTEMPSTSAETDLHSSSAAKVSLDQKKEEKPEIQIDDDGWQVYDPALFEQCTTKNTVSAVESRDIGTISSAVFEELPPNIKAQARRLKAAAEREKKPNGKKRASNANAKGPASKKKLEDFFNK